MPCTVRQAGDSTDGASRTGSSKTLIFAPVSWRMRLMLLPPEPMMLPIADCGTCCSDTEAFLMSPANGDT